MKQEENNTTTKHTEVTMSSLIGKIKRSWNMFFDNSEVFKDRPLYRYEMILHIWRSR
jgi:hypothetical protein